ncbi:MAG: sterol desaturase family protein [Chitinophagaceae bacterium]|nr:MAG: sterol desaturase family protein [Chitinophagaceae bacterium]
MFFTMNMNIIFDNWWIAILLAIALAFGRYGFLAGIAYLFCYKPGLRSLQIFKIQKVPPKSKQLRHELLFSLSTIVVFSFIGVTILWLYNKGYTKIYLNVKDHGWPYFFLSILLMIIIHDAYFYWTHRLLHTKWMMKHIHVVHHRSVNPTPWAAYAFHPLEALLEGSLAFLLVTIFPVNVYAFLFLTFFVLFMNVLGHSGYEFLSPRVRSGKIGSQFTSSTHHNLHHSKVHYNFGYYFMFWDKLMHTLHKDTFK